MATKAQSAQGPATTGSAGEGEGVRRRDFLNVAAVSFVGVGGVAALAPLVVSCAKLEPSGFIAQMSWSHS